MLFAITAKAQVDPALTSTVAAGDMQIKNELTKINEKQTTIATLQAAIYANVSKVHSIESTMYNYLSNVSVAVQNLHQIVKAAELTVEITKNLKECSSAAVGHPRGALVTALVSNRYTKAYSEMVSLYGYLKTLVLTGNDGGQTVNLLNSGERLQIASDVVDRLETVNFDIQVLNYQINYWRWADLVENKDPMSFFYVTDGADVANNIINGFKSI